MSTSTGPPETMARRNTARPVNIAAHSKALVGAMMADSAFAQQPTISAFRNAVGEDKANQFITGIGEAALRAAPGGLSVSLGDIITMTMSRLTRDDLASI